MVGCNLLDPVPADEVNNRPRAGDDVVEIKLNDQGLGTVATVRLLDNDFDDDNDDIQIKTIMSFTGSEDFDIQVLGGWVVFKIKNDRRKVSNQLESFVYQINDGKGGFGTARVDVNFDSTDVLTQSVFARDDALTIQDVVRGSDVKILASSLLANDENHDGVVLGVNLISFDDGFLSTIIDGEEWALTTLAGDSRDLVEFQLEYFIKGPSDSKVVKANLKLTVHLID